MPVNVCAFGDSITYGNTDLLLGGWVNRLKVSFAYEQNLLGTVFNHGIGGDTSYDLLRRLDAELTHRTCDAVILGVGANDVQLLGDDRHPRLTDAEFGDNLTALVKISRRHARWVFLLGITRIQAHKCQGRPIFLTSERVTAFDRKIAQVAGDTGAHFIPMQEVLTDEDLADGVHPNAEGHRKMAEQVMSYWRSCGFITP
jgi:lysophospholipase L1-like esterase